MIGYPTIPQNTFQQLRDLDRASPQFHEQLSDILHGDAYQNVLPGLQSENLAWLVEYLDSVRPKITLLHLCPIVPQVLADISDHAGPIFRESLHELGKICGVKEVLPKSCTLSESLIGCVYEGTFNGSKVRVRRVRAYPGGDPQKAKEVRTRSSVSLSSATDKPDRSSVR